MGQPGLRPAGRQPQPGQWREVFAGAPVQEVSGGGEGGRSRWEKKMPFISMDQDGKSGGTGDRVGGSGRDGEDSRMRSSYLCPK